MRELSLFSGSGIGAWAAEKAGIQTVGFSEMSPYNQALLEQHFPGLPIWQDIRHINRRRVVKALYKRGLWDGTGEPIYIISGGFPCQPFSAAGKRRGQEDDRYLWPEMLRVIAELRPTWVLGENVAGIINMGLDDVLSDLESQGYACRTFNIPAPSLDGRHRRERIWVVAHANNGRSQKRWTVGSRMGRAMGKWANPSIDFSKAKKSGFMPEDVANTTSEGFSEREQSERWQDATKKGSGLVAESQRFGNGTGWGSTKSRLGGVLDGLSSWMDSIRQPAPFGQVQEPWEPPRTAKGTPYRKDRLIALGNAWYPLIPLVIYRAIREINDMVRSGEVE